MNLLKIIIGTAVAVVVASLAACTPGNPDGQKTPSPAAKPVTIAAPPSADVSEVQVTVTGPVGDTIDIYAFYGGWDKDKKPTCTETDTKVRSVELAAESTQTVSLSVEKAGVWWWVVTSASQGVTSKCGASSTIATYQPEFGFGGPDSPIDSLNSYTGKIEVGKPFTYWVQANSDAPGDAEGWQVTVKWLGPYASVPEAQTGCRGQNPPVGATSEGVATRSDSGGGGGEFTVTLPEPGVYAVVASTPETEFSPPVTTPCDEFAPFLVAE